MRSAPSRGGRVRRSPGDRPRTWAAAAPSTLLAAFGLAFHATSAPPRTSSGAAYSTSTGSGATARAVTASQASRPAAHVSARAGTTSTLFSPMAAATRSMNAHLRPLLSISDTRAPRQGRGEDQPGDPGPRAEVGDRRRVAQLLDGEADSASAT